MKVLITGGSGFLGINLIRKLLRENINDIVVLDLVDFNYPERDKITFYKGDIRDVMAVKLAIKGVNIVVHAAAALPLYTKKDILTTDIDGTRILLEESYNEKVERFIHISSTAVYGIPDHHPLVEDDKLDGVGTYGKAKILAEKLCEEFRKKGLIVSIIRPKTFIGPERLGIFGIFYEWAKDGKNFPMIGSGKNKYQFLDVEDLCEAIWLCMIKEANIVNDTFNIGAKEFSTMKDDFQAVLDYAGYGKKIINFPTFPIIFILRILELFHIVPLYRWIYETSYKDSYVSIEKAEKKLGFVPKYSNKEALIRNYKWYLENLENIKKMEGISHRTQWKQGLLKILKLFF